MRRIAACRFEPRCGLNGWILKSYFDFLRSNGAATMQPSRWEACSL